MMPCHRAIGAAEILGGLAPSIWQPARAARRTDGRTDTFRPAPRGSCGGNTGHSARHGSNWRGHEPRLPGASHRRGRACKKTVYYLYCTGSVLLIKCLGSDINLRNMCCKLRPRPWPAPMCAACFTHLYKSAAHGDPNSLHPGRTRSCTDPRLVVKSNQCRSRRLLHLRPTRAYMYRTVY